MNRLSGTVCCWMSLSAAICLTAGAQEKYKDFDDAMIEAGRQVRRGDYPAAVEPLEAALKLAKDDAQRMKVYQALVPAYKLLPEIDKILAAQEFIIRHTERRAGRSLAARDVVSSAFQRGKTDAIAERYDAQLQKNPKDPAALTILTAIFTQTKRGDPRGPNLKKQLDDLDRELASHLAERLEKDAESAPRTTAAYLKDAATAWLEAGDKTKALAAAKKSAAGPPEPRGDLLVYYWRDGLGDVFLQTGEPQLAAAQFEAALAATNQPALRKSVEKKLAEARVAAGK